MARWILSAGIFSARAFWTANLSRKLASGSPPPSLAATVISRVSLVKSCQRQESAAPFLRLIVAHLLCPDMVTPPPILRLRNQRVLKRTAEPLLASNGSAGGRPEASRHSR